MLQDAFSAGQVATTSFANSIKSFANGDNPIILWKAPTIFCLYGGSSNVQKIGIFSGKGGVMLHSGVNTSPNPSLAK